MEVIAEIGSNFKTHGDCVRSIRAAKDVGANIVKFQCFTGVDLYGPLYSGTRELIVDIEALYWEAKYTGIEFMCTAFSPEGYEKVNPYVNRHKIASSEITAVDILEKVNSFGKPVILSTGGASIDDISDALLVLRNVPVTLMFCVVEYPARVVDFRHFDELRERFGVVCNIGYSDHTIDVLNIPSLARRRGATLIEKHVNFTSHKDTPDAPHSLNREEFAMMVKHLKNRLHPKDTFKPNEHKRMLVTLPDGQRGYFRPISE